MDIKEISDQHYKQYPDFMIGQKSTFRKLPLFQPNKIRVFNKFFYPPFYYLIIANHLYITNEKSKLESGFKSCDTIDRHLSKIYFYYNTQSYHVLGIYKFTLYSFIDANTLIQSYKNNKDNTIIKLKNLLGSTEVKAINILYSIGCK